MPYYSWTRIAAAATPPPPRDTFDTVVLTADPLGPEDLGIEAIGQLYFGTSGAGGGYYTSQATFLTDHPGLTLQDFSGIAAPGGMAAIPAFTGFTAVATGTGAIVSATNPIPNAPFDFMREINAAPGDTLTLTFSPAIDAVGMYVARPGGVGGVTIDFYNGVTLLHSEALTPGDLAAFTSTFSGYAI